MTRAIELVDGFAIFPPGNQVAPPTAIGFQIAVVRRHPGVRQVVQNGVERRAGPQQVRRQVVDALVWLVRDHQPALRIMHGQALADIVDRGVKAQVLAFEVELPPLHDFRRSDLVRHILMRHHPAKPGRVDMRGLDDAAAIHEFAYLGAQPRAVGEQFGFVRFAKVAGRLVRMISVLCRDLHNLFERHALVYAARREPVYAQVMLVPHNQLEMW